LPKVSTKAGSSTILGAVLLEGGELLGPGGRAAEDAERGGTAEEPAVQPSA
jgi:hypothetical protein